MGYSSIAWLPLCAGLTVLGLVLSYVVGRRRGYLSMLRGAAWSLLPVAAYLTGSVEMFWKIGAAIGHYADGFVFSPVKWAGIGVAGVAALLFVTTRGRERRRHGRLDRRAAKHDADSRGVAPHGEAPRGAAAHGDAEEGGARDGRRAAAEGAGASPGELSGPSAAAGATKPLGPLARRDRAPVPRKSEPRKSEPRKSEPRKSEPRKAASETGGGKSAGADDDMADIEKILRDRGI
jgi:hypothetical protein